LTLSKGWLNRFGWPETLITGHPLAIAHRGACDYAPENTLKAFRIAASLSAEMWELDIRLSSDGVCVVVHDDNLTRIARRGLRVSETTWEEISVLRLPEDQHIPSLEQVIECAKLHGCGLYIEIKSEAAGPLAWKLLQDANFSFACLASFNVNWIRQLRQLECEYPLGVLIPAGTDPFAYLDDVSVEIVHLCWRDASENPHQLLSDELMQKFSDHNHQIVIWHEDRSTVLDGLWDKPVMGICSNRPEILKPYRQDPDYPVDIIAHRGANNIAPENTLEAARICIDVIHDADLDRTTNGSGLVCDRTLAEIKNLDAGGWYRDGTAGFRVPTLAQFLQVTRSRCAVYIEIKHADPKQVLQVVKDHEMLESCFFWCADIEVLEWLREQSSEIVLMAPRWLFSSVAVAVATYGAQIIEFDVEKDDLAEINECQTHGVRSMIYSRRSGWDDLASYLEYKPNMLNLDHPDRYKILASYPLVHRHFQSMLEHRSDGQ